MTFALKNPSVDEIVAKLRVESGELDFDPQGAQLFIAVLRALSQGMPLLPAAVAVLAGELDIPTEKAGEVNWVAEKNDQGAIVGFAGLSLNDWNHTFWVNGHRFTTWCALDTLYLTPLLQQTTKVETRDPVTKEPIRLTVDPNGVRSYLPERAILSIVIPQVRIKGLQSAEQIWSAFCSYSHFFTSEQTARAWFAGKEIEPVLLTIEEGFDLGRKWSENIGRYA